jgi:hypothetical protein
MISDPVSHFLHISPSGGSRVQKVDRRAACRKGIFLRMKIGRGIAIYDASGSHTQAILLLHTRGMLTLTAMFQSHAKKKQVLI